MWHRGAPPTVVVMPTDVPVTARLDLIPVRDAMHAGVISCTADTPLVEVARILASESVHCVVISDIETTGGGQRLRWATIETRDFVQALASPGGASLAGDIATAPATTVASDASVADALALMVSADVAHLVVEDRGYPSGVLSALDIARVAGDR